jgi:hypothetical protein
VIKALNLLAVHGVGSPPLGSILNEVAARDELCDPPLYVRSDLLRDGQPFPHAVSDIGKVNIIEANWGDLRRPMRTPYGIVRHLLLLMSAMLTVPLALCERSCPGRTALAMYRAVFETVIFWAALLPVITMLVVTATSQLTAGLLACSGAVLLCVLAVIFGKFSTWYRAGYAWAVAVLVAGTLAVRSPGGSLGILTLFSTRIYLGAQIALAVLLSLCALQLLFRRRELTTEQKLAHLFLLYFPFAILSGLGALLWSATLYPSKSLRPLFSAGRFEQWGREFLYDLHYDLRYVEWVYTVAIGLIGTLALIVAVHYLLRARLEKKNVTTRPIEHRSPTDSGLAAQNGLRFLLFAMPVILSVASCYFALNLLGYRSATVSEWANHFGFRQVAGSSGTEVLNVYRTSALRVLPFLGFMVGPLTIVVDIMGDVIFFLAAGAFSIRDAAVARVASGLLATLGEGKHPFVVCHSQGTVLVREALYVASDHDLKILSLGSPIDSLYLRFLAWHPERSVGSHVFWVNGYRTGDYVGGPIQGANINLEMGSGGHTGYWQDAEVWRIVTQESEVARVISGAAAKRSAIPKETSSAGALT